MTQAVFSLIGVLVGSGVTWWIEVWRARRGDSDQGRVAARLVIDELHSIDNARTVGEPEFPEQRELAMKQDAWITHRAVLARELTGDKWEAVRASYDALSTVPKSPAGEQHVEEKYEEAMAALVPLSSRDRYWWQRLGSFLKRLVRR